MANRHSTKKVHGCTTHGMTREYRCWVAMKSRCNNTNHAAYKNYGGRGIRVCRRWINSFENFFIDMGPVEKGLSIERVDNNGDYCPENCIWADISTQQNNRRPNKIVLSSRSSSKSGVRSVCYCADDRWRASININKKQKNLGSFSNIEDAIKVRKIAELEYYPEQI